MTLIQYRVNAGKTYNKELSVLRKLNKINSLQTSSDLINIVSKSTY
jgi:hypothetical protein